MDCSRPGSSILHYLLEFAQFHVHWVGDSIEPSHPLPPAPFSFVLQSFPASGSFPVSRLFTSGDQSGASASAAVLPMNIQGWFSLGSTDLIYLQSKNLLQHHNSKTLILWRSKRLLCGPTLIYIHDYWKNHGFDYTDVCQQSDVSAF